MRRSRDQIESERRLWKGYDLDNLEPELRRIDGKLQEIEVDFSKKKAQFNNEIARLSGINRG